MKISFILLGCSIGLAAQQTCLDAQCYYSKPFYKDNEGCYAYHLEGEIKVIGKDDITNGSLVLSVLKSKQNIGQIYTNRNKNVIPYKREGYKKLSSKIRDLEAFRINDKLLESSVGAIHIHRNTSYYKWFNIITEKSNFRCLKESIRDKLVFQRLEDEEYGRHIINKNYIQVNIELMEGDSIFYSKKTDILCPNDISDKIWKDIQGKLIALDYLDRAVELSKQNTKSALRQFQIDNDIWPGYLDRRTLQTLGIEE